MSSNVVGRIRLLSGAGLVMEWQDVQDWSLRSFGVLFNSGMRAKRAYNSLASRKHRKGVDAKGAIGKGLPGDIRYASSGTKGLLTIGNQMMAVRQNVLGI